MISLCWFIQLNWIEKSVTLAAHIYDVHLPPLHSEKEFKEWILGNKNKKAEHKLQIIASVPCLVFFLNNVTTEASNGCFCDAALWRLQGARNPFMLIKKSGAWFDSQALRLH